MIYLIFGILFILYYLSVAAFTGFSAFSFIWIGGAIFFFSLFYITRYKKSWIRWIKTHRIIKGCLVGVFTVGCAIFLIVEGFIIHGMMQKGTKDLDYVVILGAQVRGEVPSRVLNSRIKQAIVYLEENSDTLVIVSGGQGPGEDISEAEAMRRYLMDKGIDEGRIIMEDKSVNTWENLKFSYDKVEKKDARIGVVSSDFHVFRAVRLAKKLGIEHAEGIAAPVDIGIKPHYMVREFFAVIKEGLVGNI